MTMVRFNSRNCSPARSEYPTSQNLMNRFWNDFENGHRERQVPSANIVETSEGFRIELSAPGFSKEDFKIKLEDQILTISGEKSAAGESNEERYLRKEFSNAAFSRSFRLSNWVDSSSITAKVENGILLVTIPKVEEAKAKPATEIVID